MILTKTKINGIDIRKMIDDFIQSNNSNQFLYIVPTNRKLRYTKKEFISKSSTQILTEINIETLSTFSTKILFENSNNKKLISEAVSSVLLKQCFNEVELKYFKEYKDYLPQGSLERIKNVISEYKKNGVLPSTLKSIATNLSETEKAKALDIANVYERYKNKFDELNVYEIGDVYESLNKFEQNEFQNRFRKLYPKVNTIIIDGFSEFTIPEIDIINSMSIIPEINIFIYFDYTKENDNLFSHLNDCYTKLIFHKFFEIEDLSISIKNSFHKNIRNNLFKLSSKHHIIDYSDQISLLIGNKKEEEIYLIAKEIKKLILKNNVEPNKICVVYNLISDYSTIIRDSFNHYGIPFNLTDRFHLKNFLPVISVINFLDILENNFYYKNIFRALSGNYIQLNNVRLNDLMKTANELKIISGLNNWKDSIQYALSNQSSKNKDIYINIIQELDNIEQLLKPFEKPLTIDEFKIQFEELIFKIGLPNKILSFNDYSIEENIKAFSTLLETIDEFLQILQMNYGKEKKFHLSFFLNQIRTAINNARFNVKEKSNYGVLITNIEEIRGLQFDYLFIGGLNDGIFPTRFKPEIFSSGSYRKSEIKYSLEERYRFYQALCCWNKKLYLSYSKTSDEKELVESSYLTELKRLFIINETEQNVLSNYTFSPTELLMDIELSNFINDKANQSSDFNLNNISNKTFSVIKNINQFLEKDKSRFLERNNNPLNGFVSSLIENVDSQLYQNKQYSISQLEVYAKCPFKYFSERILNLETIEEPEEGLEPIQFGTILHKILFLFYNEITKQKINLKNCSETTFNKVKQLLSQIAEDEINKLNINTPLAFFEKEKIFGINGDEKQSILYKFLQNEIEANDNFIPTFFELEFGKINTRENQNEERNKFDGLLIDDIELNGKIDRIDIDGTNLLYKVIDYKSGSKKIEIKNVKAGLELQIPVYLLAAKNILEKSFVQEYNPYSGEIYSLKLSENEFGYKKVKMERNGGKNTSIQEIIKSNVNMMNNAIEKIKDYVKSISVGHFYLSRLKDRENIVCRYCNFRSICRVDELK